MTQAEDRLRQIKAQQEQRTRDYHDALAKAKAIKEMHDRNMERLRSEFGLESLSDAQDYITAKQAEIEERLAELAAVAS